MAYEDVFVALADPTRRAVLESLKGGQRTVAEIASEQPVSRPAVSQHLKILTQAGLVVSRAEGTRRYYSLRREGLSEVQAYLDKFMSDVLTAYAAGVLKR